MHVVEAKRIGRKLTDGSCLLVIPFAAAAVAVGHLLPFYANVIAPGIPCSAARPCRVFPLGFREQPIALPRDPCQPRHILLGLVPAYIDHRPLTPAPAAVP